MAFNLFNLFKRKSKKQEEQEKPIEKMTFGELLKKADSIHALKLEIGSKDDVGEEIEQELSQVLALIKKAVSDPENAEAQKYVESIGQEYINAQTHLKRIKKREAEIAEIEKRYSTLRGRQILFKDDEEKALSEAEEQELEQLKKTEPERRSERSHLSMLKNKESSNITLIRLRMSRYGVKSAKVKEFDEALEKERIEELQKGHNERVKRVVEREKKRQQKKKTKKPETQPGSDE